MPLTPHRAAGALAVAAWHVGPAATWLPGVRAALFPVLDGRGDPTRVVLTFDDGPDPHSTAHFLRALDKLFVQATFVRGGPGRRSRAVCTDTRRARRGS
jgi:peptidoglycan/xylan/chitin deacetylase (PgdA/CDA1 family)